MMAEIYDSYAVSLIRRDGSYVSKTFKARDAAEVYLRIGKHSRRFVRGVLYGLDPCGSATELDRFGVTTVALAVAS